MAAFYLKYRSQRIDQLDLDNVREVLNKMATSGQIPHAFLFAGPKGTGKTSAARILAKVVNCENPQKDGEPCNKCYQCTSISKGDNLDVIELDAASNRGIDDVRSLREAVKLSPAKAKKKVYIIDEAHMLTTEASNALLKTLEEPPGHVIFILATTNPEKLIDTIRSRTTLISFRKASPKEIARSLARVVAGESLSVSGEVLEVIGKHSDGSFRDAVKTLEQLLTEDQGLDLPTVEKRLMGKGSFDTEAFLSALLANDAKACLEMIDSGVTTGLGIESLFLALTERLREALLANSGLSGKRELAGWTNTLLALLIADLAAASSDLKHAFIPQLPLEVVVVNWCSGNGKAFKKDTEKDNQNTPSVKVDKPSDSNGLSKKDELKTEVADGVVGNFDDISVWQNLLSAVRIKNASTEALLRAAKPLAFDGTNLTIGVFYKFHKERLESQPHIRLLEDVATQVMHCPVRISCALTEPPARTQMVENAAPVVLTESKDGDIIKIAEEIFGN